jgi:hypothetical protein
LRSYVSRAWHTGVGGRRRWNGSWRSLAMCGWGWEDHRVRMIGSKVMVVVMQNVGVDQRKNTVHVMLRLGRRNGRRTSREWRSGLRGHNSAHSCQSDFVKSDFLQGKLFSSANGALSLPLIFP